MSKLSPIKLAPVFKDYLWGGTKLKTEFGKNTDLDIVAESWELSAHKDGQSVVVGGEHDGCILSDYVQKAGKEVLGRKAEKFSYFLILIKLIDAKGDSVFVPAQDNAVKIKGKCEVIVSRI